MLRQFSIRRILGTMIFDSIFTIISLFISIVFYPIVFNDQTQIDFSFSNWPDFLILPQVFVFIMALWPIFFIIFSVYDGRKNPNLISELINTSLAIGTSILMLAGVLFFTYRDTSRGVFLIFTIVDLLFLLGGRIIWWTYRRSKSNHTPAAKNVLIIGAGSVGQAVVLELQKYKTHNMTIVGFIDDDPEKIGQNINGLPVLGGTESIYEVIANLKINDVVVTLPLRAYERTVKICSSLQRSLVRVHVVPDLFSYSFPGAELDGFGGIPVISLGVPGIHGWPRFIKRVFDLAVVSLGSLIISPVLIAVAVWIKLDSKGPILFKQTRIGENEKPFMLYKFRSMKIDTDDSIHREHVTRLIKENISPEDNGNGSNGETLKMDNDPRVTRAGKFIRKTSLDEFPQIINVFKGDMSLVGPRPPVPYEYEVYEDWHKRRLEVPPGITGIWQVKARNQVSFDEMVRLDLEYIEKQNLWLDFKLILQTPLSLISGKGAG